MLKYVQPGEKVTAEGYNSLVDACGGRGNSSSEGFQNTGNGTVFWPRARLSTRYYDGAWRTMLQVIQAEYWKMTTRGQWDIPNLQQTLLIDLGADAASLKSNVSVRGKTIKEAALVVGESPSMDAKVDDDLYVNASDEKTSWVDLGVKASDTDFIAGDIWEFQKKDEDDKPTGDKEYYFCITDKAEDEYEDRAKNALGIDDDGTMKLLQRYILTKKGKVGLGDDVQTHIQAHTGAVVWSEPLSGEVLSGDSQLTACHLSSIETVSCEISTTHEISGETKTEVENVNAYSFFNFGNADFKHVSEILDDITPDSGTGTVSSMADLLVRIGPAPDMSADTVLEYTPLSDLVVSCDSNYFGLDPKEMKSTSIEWTTSEKSRNALQLRGFKDDGATSPEKYNLVVRSENDEGEKKLEYVEPTDLVKVDSELSAVKRKSLEKKDDPEDADKKFIQLYKFDDPDELTLSVDKYTHLLPEGYKLVVRHAPDEGDTDAQIEYADLSIMVQNMSADSDFENKTKSIDADRVDNYFKLHNFDVAGANTTFSPNSQNNYKIPEDGKEILYRDGKELKYCNIDFNQLKDDTLSAAEKLYKADSEFPNEELSSLERRENQEDDPDHPGETKKRQEFSMFRFNQADYRMSRSEIMDDATVLMREKLTGGQTYLRYVDLSSFEQSISGDVDINQEGQRQKSIEFEFTSGDNKQKYAQLHNFDKTTADVKLNISEQETESGEKYHFLVKKISDGKLNELQYAEVSAVLSAAVDDKSIEVNPDNNDKLQLKYFDDDSYNNITLSAGEWFDKEGKQCLVGKNLETGEVNYYNFKVDLSGNAICADTEVRQDENYATQSIDEAYSTQDKAHFHRLHNFDINSALNKDDWNDEMHVLIRKKEDSNLELDYIKLSDLSGAQVSCDADGTTGKKSINHNSKEELQIYNFENGRNDLTGTFQENGMLPEGFDVLVRSDGELHYANLSVDMSGLSSLSTELSTIENNISSLSADAKTDSEVPVNLSSIERYEYNENGKKRKAYSLYDFHKDAKVALEELNKETDALLVRTGTGQKVLKYLDLSCLSGSSDISCDSDGETGFKSISKNDAGELQIYDFDHTTQPLTVTLQDNITPEGVEVLIRNDNEVQYARLSVENNQVSVDSEGQTGKSSIGKNSSDELELYGFANARQDLTGTFQSDGKLPSGFDVVVRHNNEIHYANLSVTIDKLSTDMQFRTTSNSLKTEWDATNKCWVHKIDGWDDQYAEDFDDVKENASEYDILMRHKDSQNRYYTSYLNVEPLLSGNEVSVDSAGTTNKKSVAKNSKGELELYNFDKTNTDLTVSFASTGYTPTNQLVLVKNTNNGTLSYSRLYNNVRTDTSCDTYSNSIEYNTSYNAIKINGWNTKSNKTVSEVSANSGNYDVLMRRHSGSYYYTEYLNIGPLLSASMPDGKTTELTVITNVVWDSSNYKIQPKGKKLTFVNGLLSAVSDSEFNVGGINTTPWTGE